ncbi:bifunctional aminoglycoside phosphotransferase/ATP-binding protein [Thauera sp.]|jgi:aminoglycoside phosphotransferase family enzyme/predicted kinase|uniref:bifunctional aminoglycoside phosphotransferase/ATP-binding protein n=1 Tax=Thauera sp. TaxID=1905334 RepID=UPI0026375F29|nr:bifunctional aminoglycoside phosphotransferase/ATP-binding protein [Thauera sp.]MCK6408677.1 AAA family ATPase [Thauera sp.]
MHASEELLDSLRRPGVLPGSEGGVELIETHISWVLLAGDHAWKLKKPLDLGFLDFSTPTRRRAACEAEVRLNRRTVPEIYEAVVAVSGSPQAPRLAEDARVEVPIGAGGHQGSGAAAPGAEGDAGCGAPFDYLVRMRRFDQAGLFSRLIDEGGLAPALFDRLACHVAAFHAAAAVAQPGDGFGDAAAVHAPVRQNFAQMRARIDDAKLLALLGRVEAWAEAQFAALAPLFEARLAAGRVRECHGDLHLGNLIVLDGAPRLFDAIEFSAELRWTDVIADVAFLVMDLQARSRPGLGWRFLNAWLERCGDYAGLRVLPYYLSYRAMVRAKIAAIRAAQVDGAARAQSLAECRHYLGLAEAQAAPAAPALLVACGPSGAGKTSQSQALVEAGGVIRMRADVERKRLGGLAPEAASGSAFGAGLYSAAMTARTYAHLAEAARAVVEAGRPALVDATFLKRAQRRAFAELAATLGVPFVILAFDAPPEVLRARVRSRIAAGGDASEADEAVLEAQLRSREAFEGEELARVLPIDTRAALDWRGLLPVLARLWPGAPAAERFSA